MRRFRAVVLVLAATSMGAPCLGEASADRPLSHNFGEPAGTRRFRPGTWGLVKLEAVNRTDHPAEVLATMQFAGEANQQYGRALWLPGLSRRRSWCLVRVPESLPAGKDRVELRSLLYRRTGTSDVLLSRPAEVREHSRLLPIHHERSTTGVICDAGPDADAVDLEADLAVAAFRLSGDLPPHVASMYGDFLPPLEECLQSLDHLVLSSDRLARDPAGLIAVRRWLGAGGRLWVMLDRVEPATVELLLGDGFGCRAVDRVGLTRVEIVDAAGSGTGCPPREFDAPVDLVRVLVEGVEIHHTVNGWPASFWRRFGKGRVLFTTLGARGWLRPWEPGDRKPPSPFLAPTHVAARPLVPLATRLLEPREAPALERAALEPYLTEQIGYRIAGRGAVAAVLGGFCLVVAAAGIGLGLAGRRERILGVVPGAAAAAAAALLVMGLWARRTVPPTVAVVQLVEVEPGSDDVRMTGLAAIYHPSDSPPPGSRGGGTIEVDLAGLGGAPRRVWTDLDTWHWEDLILPPGVRMASFAYATPVDRPLSARAAFGPEGLSGRLDAGDFEAFADAVVATPWGTHAALPLERNGSFTTTQRDVLAPRQFVVGGLISDEQRRRQAVYQQRIAADRSTPYPDRLMAFGWARPLEMGFTFSDRARRVGSALVAVPLALERTPAGTRVKVPSAFLPFRSVRGPLRQISGAYGNSRREWVEMRIPSEACLRFQLPEQVLPLEIDHAAVSVEINAPSRKFELFGFDGAERVALAVRHGPVGTLHFDVDRPEVLRLDDRGGWLLGLAVGPEHGARPSTDDSPMAAAAWKIDAVRLEIAGTTRHAGPTPEKHPIGDRDEPE